ncbi:MAG: hypothetical protein Q8J74_03460 [Candidatus Didemnitutus sp.]|nr:hypothetical protein [Candidatus Didemnitutus sp.]
MRKLMIGLGVLFLVGLGQAQDFTQIMTPEERAATGLAKLTAPELAALQAVVERYMTVASPVGARPPAPVKAVGAAAEVVDTAPTGAGKKGPGWLGVLISAEKVQKNASSDEKLESRLAGVLSSFTGRRKFQLENGQIWQMTQDDSYAGPVYTNPVVTVRPGALGVYWLEIPEGRVRVKVKPVKLE